MSDARPTRPVAFPLPDDTGSSPRGYDHPPASGSPYPYPSRLARLNRALRSTASLLDDMEQSAASSSDRDVATSSPNRRRRFSLMDSEDLPPHLQYASEFPMSAERETRNARNSVGWTQTTAPDQQSTQETNQRPAKRRRYDAPNPVSFARPPISYGHHGQVEPGCLKMEIISCDGGEMVDHRSPQVYLGYQNVLKADKSVYCSSHDKVSMVIRHADTTSFCIDKLHIIGPDNGFDAPVTHGVVLVAMELEHLKIHQDHPPPRQLADKTLARDARYLRLQRLRSRCPVSELSLTEALRDPEIAAFYHDFSIAPGSTEDSTHSPLDSIPGVITAGESRDIWRNRKPNETPLLPYNAATIHTYDDDPVQPDTSSSEVLEYRNHRQHTRYRQRAGLFNGGPYQPMMAPSQHWPNREDSDSPSQVDQGSQTEPQDHRESRTASVVPATSSCDSPYNDPNVHFVPFMIDKGKFKVAIKFEPQVSGRFILLKLSGSKSNVDVQSIIVSGFAGPRFFPAKEAR